MSIRFKLFGIPKTFEEFLLAIDKKTPHKPYMEVRIWIEHKSTLSLFGSNLRNFQRIVMKFNGITLHLPWELAAYTTPPFDESSIFIFISRANEHKENILQRINRMTSEFQTRNIAFVVETPLIVSGVAP